jgi:cell division protein FtsQ
MRQVKAKTTRIERPAGNGRRGAGGSRAGAPRLPRKSAGVEPARFGWLKRLPLAHPILALTAVLVVIGAGLGVFAGGHVAKAIGGMQAAIVAPFTNAGFAVREVTISGEERTTPEAASAALALTKGGSIFGVRPDAARARLLMLPWVADAEVRRHFPDTVTVRLIEKRPFALWKNGNAMSVIERSGAVITKVDETPIGHLPMIAGAGAPEAAAPIIDALLKEKAIEARLVALERIGERRWDLHLAGGVTVRLPEEGWERQLDELEKLIVEKGVMERDIEMIDLRYPDNYVFRLHNGDSRPVPRERHA